MNFFFWYSNFCLYLLFCFCLFFAHFLANINCCKKDRNLMIQNIVRNKMKRKIYCDIMKVYGRKSGVVYVKRHKFKCLAVQLRQNECNLNMTVFILYYTHILSPMRSLILVNPNRRRKEKRFLMNYFKSVRLIFQNGMKSSNK